MPSPAAGFLGRPYTRPELYDNVYNKYVDLIRGGHSVARTIVSVFGHIGVGKSHLGYMVGTSLAADKRLACSYKYLEVDMLLPVYPGAAYNKNVDWQKLLAYGVCASFGLDTAWVMTHGTPWAAMTTLLGAVGIARIFFHLDEVQRELDVSRAFLGACFRSISSSVPVLPLLTGLKTVPSPFTDMSSWSVESLMLEPFATDDEGVLDVFMQLSELNKRQEADEWRKHPLLRLLIKDAGGVFRQIRALADVVRRASTHFGRPDAFEHEHASKVFMATLDAIRATYALNKVHALLGGLDVEDVKERLFYQERTQPVAKELCAAVLYGRPVLSGSKVLEGVNVTYQQCYDFGLILPLCVQPDSVTGGASDDGYFHPARQRALLQQQWARDTWGKATVPFLSPFALFSLCQSVGGRCLADGLVNPFAAGFEGYERDVNISKWAALRRAADLWERETASTGAKEKWLPVAMLRSGALRVGSRSVRQLEFKVPLPSELQYQGGQAPLNEFKVNMLRPTPKGTEGLDGLVLLKARWKLLGSDSEEWKYGYLFEGIQAKSWDVLGRRATETTVIASELMQVSDLAFKVLERFYEAHVRALTGSAVVLLAVDIATDRVAQTTGYLPGHLLADSVLWPSVAPAEAIPEAPPVRRSSRAKPAAQKAASASAAGAGTVRATASLITAELGPDVIGRGFVNRNRKRLRQ